MPREPPTQSTARPRRSRWIDQKEVCHSRSRDVLEGTVFARLHQGIKRTAELVDNASRRELDLRRHFELLSNDLFKHSASKPFLRRHPHRRPTLLLPTESEFVGTVRGVLGPGDVDLSGGRR